MRVTGSLSRVVSPSLTVSWFDSFASLARSPLHSAESGVEGPAGLAPALPIPDRAHSDALGPVMTVPFHAPRGRVDRRHGYVGTRLRPGPRTRAMLRRRTNAHFTRQRRQRQRYSGFRPPQRGHIQGNGRFMGSASISGRVSGRTPSRGRGWGAADPFTSPGRCRRHAGALRRPLPPHDATQRKVGGSDAHHREGWG
jgi:hypothetical protein